MKFKSNRFFNKFPTFCARGGAFILFAAFGGNAMAIDIPINIISTVDGPKYNLDYSDMGGSVVAGYSTVCTVTEFEEYTGVPAATPCEIVNDIPVYCYKDSVADTAWCEFGDCPAGMFAVKTGINIYNPNVGIDLGSIIGISISPGTPLRYSAFMDFDIAGCISCDSGQYSSTNIQLRMDPSHTGNYNITNCIFPTSFTTMEFGDDSGTFQFSDCLWPNQ